ncbi:MAG: peptide-methionine (R)-S-oxide reductase MsrB [Chromatocurvus sp.]
MIRRKNISRRTVIQAGCVAALAAAMPAWARKTMEAINRMQNNWRDYLPADLDPPALSDAVELDADAWRDKLSSSAYDVLRKEGTERPFTSPLNEEKRDGLYLCAGCDLPLFTSAMKFDSGTGWPSFFTAIPEHMGTSRDFKMIWPRTEYHCTRCGGHQGHVFKDGPEPTGERWCNNGVALRFVPQNTG